MSTSPDMEPITAEVAIVAGSSELDRLRDSLNEKALQAAGRAEGAAALALQHSTDTRDRLALDLGGRISVLEDHDRTTAGDIKEIKATLAGINEAVRRSPVQQFLYTLTALSALAYFATLLWDRFIGAGAG